jgi:hypothetical protein
MAATQSRTETTRWRTAGRRKSAPSAGISSTRRALFVGRASFESIVTYWKPRRFDRWLPNAGVVRNEPRRMLAPDWAEREWRRSGSGERERGELSTEYWVLGTEYLVLRSTECQAGRWLT